MVPDALYLSLDNPDGSSGTRVVNGLRRPSPKAIESYSIRDNGNLIYAKGKHILWIILKKQRCRFEFFLIKVHSKKLTHEILGF